MDYQLELLLEEKFGRPVDELEDDNSGCYDICADVWISPALIVRMCKKAYDLGEQHGRFASD